MGAAIKNFIEMLLVLALHADETSRCLSKAFGKGKELL